MATLPPGFLDELKARIAVSDVVARKVKLTRKGREFIGLSPFNAEKTPSFTVNDAKGFFHCFSSGEHGDVFSFLMKTEGLGFMEAVEAVADMAGMETPKATPEDRQRAEQAKGLRDAVAIACDFFQSQLRMPAGREAMDYLRGRGLDDAAMRRFRLGYAPADRMAILAALRREGVSDELAVEAGLARRGDDGRIFGYFKDRAIFTIADPQGRPIGFGARALGDAQPKYLNSPDGPLFHKGETLYGLDLAREPAHKAGEIVVVEGYMDAIAMAEAGLPQTVAPLGTAITEAQIKRLWRIAGAPVLCLDGDAAGRRAAGRAALRALPILEPGRSLRFALLDGGRDPDDLIKAEGPQAVRQAVDNAVGLMDIVWQDALAEIDPTQPEQRAALDKQLMRLASEVQDQTVQGYVRDDLRQRLRQAFRDNGRDNGSGGGGQSARRWGDRRGFTQRPAAPILPRPARSPAAVARTLSESRTLYVCFSRPAVAEPFAERLALLACADPALNRLREALVDALLNESPIDVETIRGTLIGQGLGATLSQIERDVLKRGRPHALLGDAADAAEWIDHSLEALERSDADRGILERARLIADDDEAALSAVELEAMASARRRSADEST